MMIFNIFLFLCAAILLPAKRVNAMGAKKSVLKTDYKGEKENDMTDGNKLTDQEGKYLLSLARRTIENRLFNRNESQSESGFESGRLMEERGTFVTLNINGALRGCIGTIIPREGLIDSIRSNSIDSAFHDPRFRPMTTDEWKRVKIEISILTEPVLLQYSSAADLLDKLRPGIDGVILKKGPFQATFLPQVWDQLPEKREFLNHLCSKAGLSANEWKKGDITVYIYQVQAFEEKE